MYNQSLQSLLCKILNKSIIDKFHNELQKNNINHTTLSIESGKHHSAFNKTFNKAEQLELSSFLRYWYAASTITNSTVTTGAFALENFIQEEEVKILALISSTKDSSITSLDRNDIQFIKHLKFHFDFLYKNKKLTTEEIKVFNQIYSSIN